MSCPKKVEGWKGIANKLGVSVKKARRLWMRHGLPLHKFFDEIYTTEDELEAFRQEHDRPYKYQTSSSEPPPAV